MPIRRVKAISRFSSSVLQSSIELPYQVIRANIGDVVHLVLQLERRDRDMPPNCCAWFDSMAGRTTINSRNPAVPKDLTAAYFLEEFEAEDLGRRPDQPALGIRDSAHRAARKLASSKSQLWLHEQNRMGYEVYCSPNSGPTPHVYLQTAPEDI